MALPSIRTTMQRLRSLGALTALALGASFVSAQQDPAFIRLRFASFDPLASLPAIPAALQLSLIHI